VTNVFNSVVQFGGVTPDSYTSVEKEDWIDRQRVTTIWITSQYKSPFSAARELDFFRGSTGEKVAVELWNHKWQRKVTKCGSVLS
jgi:hypothetical protein